MRVNRAMGAMRAGVLMCAMAMVVTGAQGAVTMWSSDMVVQQ